MQIIPAWLGENTVALKYVNIQKLTIFHAPEHFETFFFFPLPALQGRGGEIETVHLPRGNIFQFYHLCWQRCAAFYFHFPTGQGHLHHLHFMELFLRRRFWFVLMCVYMPLCFFLTRPEYSAPTRGKVNKFIQITWEWIWNVLRGGNDCLGVRVWILQNPQVAVLEASLLRLFPSMFAFRLCVCNAGGFRAGAKRGQLIVLSALCYQFKPKLANVCRFLIRRQT